MKITLTSKGDTLHLFPAIKALTLPFLLPVVSIWSEEFHNFQNNEGKSVRAVLVAVDGNSVSLKREDGRVIRCDTTIFSPLDQEYIKNWAGANKAATDSQIRVCKITKVCKDRSKRLEGAVDVSYQTLCYKVELENKAFLPVTGLEAEYRLYKLKGKVDADAGREKDAGLKTSGGYTYRQGSYSIGDIARLGRASFETESLAIMKSNLLPGWYYPDGRDDKGADDLKGIWLRVMQGGKLVFEYKTVKGDVTW